MAINPVNVNVTPTHPLHLHPPPRRRSAVVGQDIVTWIIQAAGFISSRATVINKHPLSLSLRHAPFRRNETLPLDANRPISDGIPIVPTVTTIMPMPMPMATTTTTRQCQHIETQVAVACRARPASFPPVISGTMR